MTGAAKRADDLLRYDCDAGFDNWQVGWSNSKIDFCCQMQQKGCAHVVPLAVSLDRKEADRKKHQENSITTIFFVKL